MSKTIKVNGIDQSIPNGAVLFGEYITDLNKSLSSDQQVISNIRIDGREITEADEEKFKTHLMSDLGQIELETARPADLAFQTLDTLEQYLDRLLQSIERTALHYRGKNLITGDAYFAKSIDGIDLFVQTIGGIKLALRIGLNTKLALAEAELVSIMNDLLDAKRQNNYIFMADLLEHELMKNLGEWKSSIFPLLRNLKSS